MNEIFSKTKIFDFLNFGYLPGEVKKPHNIIPMMESVRTNIKAYDDSNRDEVINRGVSVLKNVIKDELENGIENKNHVVPLSGGMDSRAILCGPLEHIDAKQIRTVTFGTPGTWDFEIGNRVAKKAGVIHEIIDLTSSSWKWDYGKISTTAHQTKNPITLFDTYVNHQIPELFGEDCVYWSGFMGDPLSGSRLPKNSSQTWKTAKQYFLSKNKIAGSIDITPPNYDPMKSLPEKPLFDPVYLCFDDQLDFFIRQNIFIKQILLTDKYHYRTPFLQPEWVSLFINLPTNFRKEQWLYKEMLQKAYPVLFSLPVKNNYGYPLCIPSKLAWPRRGLFKAKRLIASIAPGLFLGVDPRINYIDFDRGIRERQDLKELVYASIQDLTRRDLISWLDIEEVWDRHQRKLTNHADALLILTALEIYLKVEENSFQVKVDK